MAQTWEEFAQTSGLEKDGTKRLPICFCLDTSGSMRANQSENRTFTGEVRVIDGRKRKMVTGGVSAMMELKRGMKHFLKKIKEDPMASSAAEIAIVTFDDYAKTVLDFCQVECVSDDVIETLDTRDNTYMGEGLNLALDKLERCLEKYKTYGIDYFAPWLVIMSDGAPSDSSYELGLVSQRIADMCRCDNLLVIPVAIGNAADIRNLSKMAQGRKAEKIYNINFEYLFENMTDCLCRMTRMVDGSDIVPIVSAEQQENSIYDKELFESVILAPDAEEVTFEDD